ncbi:ParA family protein [Candidatus Poribacteria bacterium]
MLKIIAIANQKGGVAKTTTVVNLAAALGGEGIGKRVLVIDLDPQANASLTLGDMHPLEAMERKRTIYNVLMDKARVVSSCSQETRVQNVSLVYGDLRFTSADLILSRTAKSSIALTTRMDAQVSEDFDYVLLDCPPNLGMLTINALVAATHYIIPVEANSYYALVGLTQLQDTIEEVLEVNADLVFMGALLTLFRKNEKISRAMNEEIRRHFGPGKVFQTVVNRNAAVEQATSVGQTIFEYDGRTPGAKDYMALAKEINGLGL